MILALGSDNNCYYIECICKNFALEFLDALVCFDDNGIFRVVHKSDDLVAFGFKNRDFNLSLFSLYFAFWIEKCRLLKLFYMLW